MSSLVVHVPAEGPTRAVDIRGRRMVVDASRFGKYWDKVAGGAWEPATFAAFDNLIEPGGTVVDVGAWIGVTALYAAHTAGRVIAFEPDPEALPILKRNLALNPELAARIELHEAALGTGDGTAALHNNSPGDSATSLRPVFGYKKTAAQRQFAEAAMIDGRRFLEGLDLGRVSLLKIDIEGGEYELIPHLAPWLRRHRPSLHLSLHPFNLVGSGSAEEDELRQRRATARLIEALAGYRYVWRETGAGGWESLAGTGWLMERLRREGSLGGALVLTQRGVA
jgi:FkbM family methyltransferase